MKKLAQTKTNIIDDLLKLTRNKQFQRIKEMLENLDVNIKGFVFEIYIEELFKGNGWLTARRGGKNDLGADILLYHPKNPTDVSIIVQTKNHRKPLSFDDSRVELIKFEEKAQKAYKCNNYTLISINGFVKNAVELEEFNMKMEGWEYVVKLIENYYPDAKSTPDIELFAHNKLTYNKIIENWKTSDKVAAVQATGTGKSFLIIKTLAHFYHVNKLVLAPSQYILDSIQENALWANKRTIYMTYARLMNLNIEELLEMKLEYLVLDEFHRVGAEKWGEGVERLLQAYPNIIVLGTSATPIRYLDNSRDMTIELFNGKVASNIPLPDAIVKGYVPKPYYVSSLYTLEEEVGKRRAQINASSIKNNEKEELLLQLKTIETNWEKSAGVSKILRKHLSSSANKFIVFCRNKEHLSQMEWLVEKWFKESGVSERIKKNRVISDDKYKGEELREFIESKRTNTTHLLFAIDMLNEGLHIDDVTGVILLRPTISPIIFYQQIGRAINSSDIKKPIIFDLVNNFSSIMSEDFVKDLNNAQENENNKREKLNLPKKQIHFSIYSEAKDAVMLFNDIDDRLINSWDYYYRELAEYKDKYGNCLVPVGSKTYPQLGKWVSRQRRNYFEGRLSQERISKLEQLHFYWKPDEDVWNERYEILVKFKETYGHCLVPHSFNEVPGFYHWVVSQRTYYAKGTLSPERVEKLNEIGFAWNKYEYEWEVMYKELVEYKEEFGDCFVPPNYPKNNRLAQWMTRQRDFRKKDELSPERISKLDQLGFPWDYIAEKWEAMYQELSNYHNLFDDCLVLAEYDKELYHWVKRQRKNFHAGKLDQVKKNQLEMLNFSWSPLEDNWNNYFKLLVEYKEIYGDCYVPAKYKENPQLGTWANEQRKFYKRETLAQEKIERLEGIGFVWDVATSKWNQYYQQLKDFYTKHGHTQVPTSDKSLSNWVKTQRKKYTDNKLSLSQVEQLNGLNFVWDFYDNRWNTMCNMLKDYQQIIKDVPIIIGYEEYKELGTWVITQRGLYHKGEQSEERIQKLEDIGFFWSKEEEDWTFKFNQLRMYQDKHGDCLVPTGYADNKELAYWVSLQRKQYKLGTLKQSKVNKLNDLGFRWNPKKENWDGKYELLVEYKNANGDCLVNKHHPELGSWVIKQRALFKNGTLDEYKLNKLNSISFIWDVVEYTWNERYLELVQYQIKHGDCKVLKRYPVLGPWVQSQRLAHKEGRLNKERIKKLENLGFIWNM